MSQRPISDIPGIKSDHIKILLDLEIKTCYKLLCYAAPHHYRGILSKLTKIDTETILRYANYCDLLRVQRLGPRYIPLLIASEVKTVLELSERNPINLHKTMIEINDTLFKYVDLTPPFKHVQRWVISAKELPKLITYR